MLYEVSFVLFSGRFGTNAMPYGELALPAATIVAFAIFVMATKPTSPRQREARSA